VRLGGLTFAYARAVLTSGVHAYERLASNTSACIELFQADSAALHPHCRMDAQQGDGPMTNAPKLDARETHAFVASPHAGLRLFLRHLPPPEAISPRDIVLYVHGGTFSSALSIAHRFDGRSWRDALCDAGFHVWGLDFHGFGRFSDPYPDTDPHTPLGRTADASRQLEAAVRFILAHHGAERLSLVAHSWGTMVSGHFAGRCPEMIDRMVFFGPIAQRLPLSDAPRLPAWRLITLQDQWDRFTADVPPDQAPVLSKRHFDEWGEAYLDSDPESRDRRPASVKTPSGAFQDIFDAWAGTLSYDPTLVRAPVAIIRGEWDSMCTDADAAWLRKAMPAGRNVKIPQATHLMHLEENRYVLFRETEAFLNSRED
jgi:pimeloyl-ACP methyl ester carboxylesterase